MSARAALPITRKSDLRSLQQREMPFGGLAATPARQLRHVYVSPGPIYDPEGRGRDWWRFARPMYAAGVRPGGLLQNCFSYHFTPAAFMVEGGAARIGCAVIPAGAGQTEMQVQAMVDLRPDTYVGTPSFLRIIIEKAREMGADISSVQHALVGAEALPESLRYRIARTKNVALQSDLYAVPSSGGRVRRLTRQARAADPDVPAKRHEANSDGHRRQADRSVHGAVERRVLWISQIFERGTRRKADAL